ncbi:MAG TPA: oligosaccharide flippase family protein, partial [Bacteroidales bacterium]|nr:oligosaccharide flippase family protein [Bacteroidales bacterium]
MRRKFFTNLTLLLFLNLLIKPFWIFGIDRTVQNVVGAEEYGLYFSLFNFSLLLNMLLDLGITNFNNRNIAQNSHLLSKSLSSIISLRLLLALGYAIVTIIAALFVGYEGRQFYLLLCLIFNQFVASFILYLRSNLSGLHFFKTDSIISVLDRFVMILICGLLLWGGVTKRPFQIEWFVYAQTAAYLFTLVLTLGIVYSKAQFLKLKFDRTYFMAILKKSYPFALLSLLMAFYYRIDSVMLERMLPDGKEQAGIYAQGFRILDAAAMFAFLYAGLLLPMFSRMIKQKKSIHQLTLFSFLLLIVPVVGITFASFFYRIELINLLYHHHVETSATIFGILILCFLGISTSYIFGTLLTANGNLRMLNFMAVGGVLVNITLNIILIP